MATALVTLAACAQAPDSDSSGTALAFSEDFSESADGPPVAGWNYTYSIE